MTAARAARAMYGSDLAQHYGAQDAPAIVSRSRQHADFAVTELRVVRPNGELSDALPAHDAHMICLVLRDLPKNSYWEEGRERARHSLQAGDTSIADLRREPLALIDKPIHSLLMYLPRATLNTLCDEGDLPRVENLRFQPGAGFRDETIQSLGLSILPALQEPDCVNQLYTDHFALALTAHVIHAYGGQDTAACARGGLAPWQEKRAKDMIRGDLAGETPLREIAGACGLSVSYFSRSFRKSTGLAPYAFLLEARVQKATTLLRRREDSLEAVALACGFADQNHFTRVFTRRMGVSPGLWRRMLLC